MANPATTTAELKELQRKWSLLHEPGALAPGSQAPENECSKLLFGKSMNWGKGLDHSNCNHYYYIDASKNKQACRLDGRGCAPRSRWRGATKPYDEGAAIEALRQQIEEGKRRGAEVARDQARALAAWRDRQRNIDQGRKDVAEYSSAETDRRTKAALAAVDDTRGPPVHWGKSGRGGKRRKSRRRNTRHRRKSHGRKRVRRRKSRARGRRRTRR